MTIFLTGAAGYIGGTVAQRLIAAGCTVRGLVRDASRGEQLRVLGIEPVVGTLDERELLIEEARRSSGVVHAADSDHAAAIDALIEGLNGSGNPLLHTSGSSVIGDDARGQSLAATIYDEDTPFVVAPLKQPRREIELKVLAAKDKGIRSIVICPSNIYGEGTGIRRESVQIPMLIALARESGVVRHVGSGVNRWSQVHVADLAELYLLVLEKAPAGAFYFAENGEASYFDLGASLALRLGLDGPENWPIEEAVRRWGEVHAHFTFGTNSRVAAKRARAELGWAPRHNSVLRWIEQEMQA